jgi:elongator complex protein 2
MEAAVLPGHEDWVKALAFCSVGDDPNQEPLTLASGSQDGTIRLWTITLAHEEAPPALNALDDQLLDAFEASLADMTNDEHGKQLSTKQHLIKVTDEAG